MEDSELMAYRGGNLSNELLYMINYTEGIIIWVQTENHHVTFSNRDWTGLHQTTNNQLLFEVKLVGERESTLKLIKLLFVHVNSFSCLYVFTDR